MLDLLINTLITRGKYEELRGYHHTIRVAAIYIALCSDNEYDRHLVIAVLEYAERYGEYPTYDQLEEFVTSSPHRETGTGNIGDMLGMRCREIADAKIAVHQGSWRQMMDAVCVTGRSAMYVQALQRAMAIISAGASVPGAKLKDPDPLPADRVAAALKYFDEVRAGDFTVPPSSPEGAWRENADLSADALIDGLKDTIRDRCYTGFKHIDDVVTIGPKQPVRYIGILGFTNHGKSMLLRTMVYNMAKAGKRILFIAREDSALNTWTQLSFLHSYSRRDLHLPPVNVWRNQPHKVTAEEQDDLRVLIDDLQHGKSVPGEIVVKTLGKWAEVLQELEVGHNGKPYDVLALDYLAHLDTGMTGPKMHEEYKRLFKEAQKLAIDYKGGRGLVVITPLQANKAGMKAADEEEEDKWGIYPDLGSVEQYTDAARDMDLIISVWHKGALKDTATMKLACLKSRENLFNPHFVRIDRRTRMVMDLPGHAKSDVHMISAYHAEADEAQLTTEEVAAY